MDGPELALELVAIACSKVRLKVREAHPRHEIVSIVLNFEPIIALVAARLIIGERMEAGTAVGTALIVLSILAATRNMPHRSLQ